MSIFRCEAKIEDGYRDRTTKEEEQKLNEEWIKQLEFVLEQNKDWGRKQGTNKAF